MRTRGSTARRSNTLAGTWGGAATRVPRAELLDASGLCLMAIAASTPPMSARSAMMSPQKDRSVLLALEFRAVLYTVLYDTIRYHTIPYHTILYYTILYYTILYYTILYYTILYYTILTILYDTTLYYTILNYTRLHGAYLSIWSTTHRRPFVLKCFEVLELRFRDVFVLGWSVRCVQNYARFQQNHHSQRQHQHVEQHRHRHRHCMTPAPTPDAQSTSKSAAGSR